MSDTYDSEITVSYLGNRYAGRVDDINRPCQPGTTVFEATGPMSAFEFTGGRYRHVRIVDREAVTVKELQVL